MSGWFDKRTKSGFFFANTPSPLILSLSKDRHNMSSFQESMRMRRPGKRRK